MQHRGRSPLREPPRPAPASGRRPVRAQPARRAPFGPASLCTSCTPRRRRPGSPLPGEADPLPSSLSNSAMKGSPPQTGQRPAFSRAPAEPEASCPARWDSGSNLSPSSLESSRAYALRKGAKACRTAQAKRSGRAARSSARFSSAPPPSIAAPRREPLSASDSRSLPAGRQGFPSLTMSPSPSQSSRMLEICVRRCSKRSQSTRICSGPRSAAPFSGRSPTPDRSGLKPPAASSCAREILSKTDSASDSHSGSTCLL
jgi:hypothetical protein